MFVAMEYLRQRTGMFDVEAVKLAARSKGFEAIRGWTFDFICFLCLIVHYLDI